MDPIFGTHILTDQIIAFRMLLSFIAGTIVGFERAKRKQPAGLRTHILIAIGCTLFMLLSIWVPQEFSGGTRNGDPTRIAAQVVSGIGFLGAGAILRLGNNIRGLTSAASIWLVAALGMGIGAGMYLPSLMGLGLAMFALVILPPIERKLLPEVRIKHLEINYSGGIEFLKEARKVLHELSINIYSTDVKGSESKEFAVVNFLVSIPSTTNVHDLYQAIRSIGNVNRVEIKEKF